MEYIYTATNIDHETHYGVVSADDAIDAINILRAAHKDYYIKLIDEIKGRSIYDGRLGKDANECHYNVAVKIDGDGSIYWADLTSDLCRQWWKEDDLGPFVYDE